MTLHDPTKLVRPDGVIVYFIKSKGLSNEQLHREDGPAYISPSGMEMWFRYGKRHRTDGPAVLSDSGVKAWWLYGVRYDPIEWLLKLHEFGLK